MIQASLNFDEPPPPALPPAVDSHLPSALKRIQLPHNRNLLTRLLHGPIESDELESCRALFGKRGSARLHDVREWLRALGYEGKDPIPGVCLDAKRGISRWALTDEAAQIARLEMEARG